MSLREAQEALRNAAADLGFARIDEAEAFLRFRNTTAKTDNAAKAMATVEMMGRVEKYEAEYEIAKSNLRAQVADIVRERQ